MQEFYGIDMSQNLCRNLFIVIEIDKNHFKQPSERDIWQNKCQSRLRLVLSNCMLYKKREKSLIPRLYVELDEKNQNN